MRDCPKCGVALPDTGDTCPVCGCSVPDYQSRVRLHRTIAVVVIIAAVGGMCALFLRSDPLREVRLLVEDGDFGQALDHLRIIVAAKPKLAEAQYLMAKCFLELDRDQQATGPLAKAMQLDKSYRARAARLYLHYGERALRRRELQRGFARLREACRIDTGQKPAAADVCLTVAEYWVENIDTDRSEKTSDDKDLLSVLEQAFRYNRKHVEPSVELAFKVAELFCDAGEYDLMALYADFTKEHSPTIYNKKVENLHMKFHQRHDSKGR